MIRTVIAAEAFLARPLASAEYAAVSSRWVDGKWMPLVGYTRSLKLPRDVPQPFAPRVEFAPPR